MTTHLGVVIVTYNSAAHITACLDSLAKCYDVFLNVIVVDNASSDDTCALVETWQLPSHMALNLVKADQNKGFAAGVNIGLKLLITQPQLDRFWILNPDCTCTESTPAALAKYPMPFALLGCRITYDAPADQIQIDAGTVNRWTGATSNLNLGKSARETLPPDPEIFDFISGASMVASRVFIEMAGLMPEHYFLYYEEVDWAARRGTLPLTFCKDACVMHTAGASIGSPTLARGPSEVSVYFKHRARLKFVARFNPIGWPLAYAFGWAKILQHVWRREIKATLSVVRAIHGLPPSSQVKHAISTKSQDNTKSLTAEIKRA